MSLSSLKSGRYLGDFPQMPEYPGAPRSIRATWLHWECTCLPSFSAWRKTLTCCSSSTFLSPATLKFNGIPYFRSVESIYSLVPQQNSSSAGGKMTFHSLSTFARNIAACSKFCHPDENKHEAWSLHNNNSNLGMQDLIQ